MNALLHFGGRPLLACVLLSAIHMLLGRDLTKRSEGFAALAIPQCAALGAAVSLFLGNDLHSLRTTLWSCAVAVALSFVRQAPALFAGAAAATALVLSRTVAAGDHLRHLVGGDLLPVSMREIVGIAIVFAVIATIRKFRTPEPQHPSTLVLVAIVAGVAVPIAGVLLVFAYFTIAPALTRRFATAWPTAAVVSAVGVAVALLADLPTGATIVCAFVLAFLGMQAA